MCGSEINVEDKVLVAFGADEGDAQVADGSGEGVGEGLDGVANGVHDREVSGRLARGGSDELSLNYLSDRGMKTDRIGRGAS